MNVRIIRELVEEVLRTCRWDDTGVTTHLIELALDAAQEIGMTREEVAKLAE